MSVERCACPSCRKVYRVPDQMIGQQSRCAVCGIVFVVKKVGGKTTLEIAGVSPDTPTATYAKQASSGSATVVIPPKAARFNRRIALAIGSGVLASLLLCGIGAGAVSLWKSLAVYDQKELESELIGLSTQQVKSKLGTPDMIVYSNPDTENHAEWIYYRKTKNDSMDEAQETRIRVGILSGRVTIVFFDKHIPKK